MAKKENDKLMKKYLILIVIALSLTSIYFLFRIQTFIKPIENKQVAQTVVSIDSPIPTIKLTAQPTKKPSTESQTQTSTDKLPVLSGSAIFGLINDYRASNGKLYWSVSDELCRLAERRAEYLIQPTYEDFMKNTYPSFNNHPGFQDMTSAFNYSGLALSENLAMGAKSDAGVLSLWKNSPAHNSLMLTTDYNGTTYTKACVATRVKYYGSITVLLAGDK